MSDKKSARWGSLPDNLKDRVVVSEHYEFHAPNLPYEPDTVTLEFAPISIIFDITPRPAPRMVRSDKWKKRPVTEKCFAWRNELRLMANEKGYKLSQELDIIFIFPMPKSWSKKKKNATDGCPHMQRPDLDNLIKNWQDTFTDEDGYVYKIKALKLWGRKGQIIINS